jgi:hypothetical protein
MQVLDYFGSLKMIIYSSEPKRDPTAQRESEKRAFSTTPNNKANNKTQQRCRCHTLFLNVGHIIRLPLLYSREPTMATIVDRFAAHRRTRGVTHILLIILVLLGLILIAHNITVLYCVTV